jgi:ABC-type branched-subunit amino acid transport system substrate-binding protein
VTDKEIRIGASGPLSGVAGFLGEEAFGAIDSYFQLINSQGGINGRKIRLITYDDRFDSSQTLANVQRLYEQDKVAAIFLAFGDPVADYVTRNKIPTLVFGVTPKSFASKYPTVFPLVGNALLWTQEVIVGLKEKGVFKQGMRVGMLYDTQILDVTPYVPFLKQSWENAGAKVV